MNRDIPQLIPDDELQTTKQHWLTQQCIRWLEEQTPRANQATLVLELEQEFIESEPDDVVQVQPETDWIHMPYGEPIFSNYFWKVRQYRLINDRFVHHGVSDEIYFLIKYKKTPAIKCRKYVVPAHGPPAQDLVFLIDTRENWWKAKELNRFYPSLFQRFCTEEYVSNPDLRRKLVNLYDIQPMLTDVDVDEYQRERIVTPCEENEVDLYEWIHDWYMAQDRRKYEPIFKVGMGPGINENIVAAIFDTDIYDQYRYSLINTNHYRWGAPWQVRYTGRIVVVKVTTEKRGYSVIVIRTVNHEDRDLVEYLQSRHCIEDAVINNTFQQADGSAMCEWFTESVWNTFGADW